MTNADTPMIECVIYKSDKKPDSYLYVERADDFSRVPEVLLSLLGRLEQVMTLQLSEQRKLARADVAEVMAQLHSQGYYLQMPPQHHPVISSG